MNFDGTPVKAQPASRRKIMPPTPPHSLQPSTEAVQLQTEVGDEESGSCEMEYESEHRWTARDRTVIARVEQHENDNSEVDLRFFLRFARRKMGGRIFEIFSSKGQSELLVASRMRRDERQRVLVTQEEDSRRRHKKLTTMSIKIGQQSTNRLQEECCVTWTQVKL